jgi:hypothetical protein
MPAAHHQAVATVTAVVVRAGDATVPAKPRRRCGNAPNLIALVRARARLVSGGRAGRRDQRTG